MRFGVNAIKTIVLLYGFIAKTQPCKRSLSVLQTYSTQHFYYSSYNDNDIIVINAGLITSVVPYIRGGVEQASYNKK